MSSDPATPSASDQGSGPEIEHLFNAGGSLIEQDAIKKIDAGAQLIHMLYHHPRAQALLASEFATLGFIKAYGKACGAYGVGGL